MGTGSGEKGNIIKREKNLEGNFGKFAINKTCNFEPLYACSKTHGHNLNTCNLVKLYGDVIIMHNGSKGRFYLLSFSLNKIV